MRIIIDTEKNRIIVPNSYFKQIDRMNKVLKEAGAEDKLIDSVQYIKDSFAKAMEETPIRLSDVKNT